MQNQRQGSFFGARAAQLGAPAVTRTVDERIAFIRRVYGWMFAGILATVMGVAIAVKSGLAEDLLLAGIFPNIMLMLVWIGGAYGLQKVRHVPTWNVVAFFTEAEAA